MCVRESVFLTDDYMSTGTVCIPMHVSRRMSLCKGCLWRFWKAVTLQSRTRVCRKAMGRKQSSTVRILASNATQTHIHKVFFVTHTHPQEIWKAAWCIWTLYRVWWHKIWKSEKAQKFLPLSLSPYLTCCNEAECSWRMCCAQSQLTSPWLCVLWGDCMNKRLLKLISLTLC